MLHMFILLVNAITYMLIPALCTSTILIYAWHYIYWYFTYKYIHVYEHINIFRSLYVLPALFHAVVIFMISEDTSYFTLLIHIANVCIDIYIGIYLHRKYLEVRYDYLFKKYGPYEVVRRFSHNMYIGDKLESFDFFEFFSRARTVMITNQSGSQYGIERDAFNPDKILNNKYFIGMTRHLNNPPSYELFEEYESRYFYKSSIKMDLIPPDKFIIMNDYNIYGPLNIIHMDGSGGRKYTLLFKAGPHYDNFVTL